MSFTVPAAFFLTFLAILPAVAGVDDEWTALYNQGQLAEARKDYAKAEEIFGKALHDAELFGQNDRRVASTSQAIGRVLHFEKRLGPAEDAIRRAVTIYSTNPGEDSMPFAQAQFDLAGVLMDENKYQPALQELNRLLPYFDRNLGPSDNLTAAALCMQGDAFRQLKLYASAETPLKRCADIESEDGDMGSPRFGEAANSLALVYQHLGKYAEADRYFTYAEKIRESTLGIMSPALAETLEAHAALLHQLGRDAEAKPKERMAAAIRSHTGWK